mmetsp:Transcript_117776/g.380068  ORF Transcript_117776/g.380068 Transcript_117776/m.380068 type:complete len:261 (+) Transcript_117776:1190-1972(+)
MRQSWWRSSSASESTFRAFDVVSRSPSPVAFASFDSARPIFASFMSFVANLMSSSNDCFSISKLWSAEDSFLRDSARFVCAFSRRLSSVSMMFPLWPSYAAAAGAPRARSSSPSSESCELCTSAASFSPSLELIAEACTRYLSASAMVLAVFVCSMDSPFRISRSRTLMDRSSMSMTSDSSFSSVAKSAASFARISEADFKSASSPAMLVVSSSILALCELRSDSCLRMEACSSAAWDLPVLIWKASSLERSPQSSSSCA